MSSDSQGYIYIKIRTIKKRPAWSHTKLTRRLMTCPILGQATWYHGKSTRFVWLKAVQSPTCINQGSLSSRLFLRRNDKTVPQQPCEDQARWPIAGFQMLAPSLCLLFLSLPQLPFLCQIFICLIIIEERYCY